MVRSYLLTGLSSRLSSDTKSSTSLNFTVNRGKTNISDIAKLVQFRHDPFTDNVGRDFLFAVSRKSRSSSSINSSITFMLMSNFWHALRMPDPTHLPG